MKIYNTLTRKIEELKPQQKGKIKMYVCGLTPYDYAHIGHARTYIFFDTFKRYLRYKGYEVVDVQNFTDVDDKIIDRAIKENKTYKEISEKYEKAFLEDMERLNIITPKHMPKVSDHIEEISQIIEKLKSKGFAYEISDGIYYHVPKFKEYGKLSHQNLEELNKHRIEPNPEKLDPKDFALWKFPKKEDKIAQSIFNSKCCKTGRPGWHIECSAMSMKYLGETLDIHGGGKDLIFPHHENEIAQSEAATGKPFSKYWMHVHFVNIKGEKMSKSLKNFITIREILTQIKPSTLRIFLLSAHYRKDIDYNEQSLEEAKIIDKEIRNAIAYALHDLENHKFTQHNTISNEAQQQGKKFYEEFTKAMDEDVHTEKALMVMKNLATYILNKINEWDKENKSNEEYRDELLYYYDLLIIFNNILGIYKDDETLPFSIPKDIKQKVEKRNELRSEKQYEEADKIRNEILEKGYVLIDSYKKTRIIPKYLLEVW